MNREILFRGKLPDTGGWVYGYYCKHIKRQVCPVGDELKPEDIAHLIINDAFADWNMPRSLQSYDIDPETVGQYTGLKDKNGVEVYEGDIVKCTEPFPDELEFISKIFWGGSGFLVKKGAIYYPVDIYDSNPGRVSLNKMEIIGNIHDNPELLEVLDE